MVEGGGKAVCKSALVHFYAEIGGSAEEKLGEDIAGRLLLCTLEREGLKGQE